MRKKILGAATMIILVTALFVTSNIQEETNSAAGEQKTVLSQAAEKPKTAFKKEKLFAGVAFALSANSFTTESDEETGIKKREVVFVTSSNDSESNLEDDSSEEVETETQETQEGQVEEAYGDSETTAYENRWNISLTEDEIDLLAKIVWLEANGEPVEGQEAVVEVVLNRMASDLYPDTLYDVLSQNNPVQFVSWKRRDKAQPTETEYQSIYNVLNGNTNLLRNDTLYFSTYPLTSKLDVKICCHYFCY